MTTTPLPPAEAFTSPADDPALRLARNAVTAADVNAVALNRDAVIAVNPTTEVKLDSLGVSDQKQSGRCWMFAAYNVFRHRIADDLGMKSSDGFEFSHTYLQFYDKVEKSNHVLRSLAALFAEGVTDLDDRTVSALLDQAASDGGQWNYFTNLVAKYGVVPKYTMPETFASGRTSQLDGRLRTVLRRGALRLRENTADAGADAATDTESIIAETLADAHRVIAVHLGLPPTEFAWRYRDKDGTFHDEGTLTPQEFAARVLPDNLDTYVSVVHDPRHETGRAFHITHENNMWGTADFSYVTADIDDLRTITRTSLDAGEPVWFACDVNRQFVAKTGVWHSDLLELDALYGTDSATTKAEQMDTAESRLTHGMVFTGYDTGGDTGTTWRVENSWGTKSHGEHSELAGKGYGTMADNWFGDNVFQVVVPRRLLEAPELTTQLNTDLTDPHPPHHAPESTALPIWDAKA
ncbi:MAG: aminopeptidase [Corynebacterium sp.]|uniref:aminopeptidase C n=1 Tax=Corynebacterium sp. TaxID=1720 RepID=UPI002647B18D|nr:C1 family peptidase [Corynebacterium sp.]MDN6282886.1 aminopeptidase [Corynebacterium sp.]